MNKKITAQQMQQWITNAERLEFNHYCNTIIKGLQEQADIAFGLVMKYELYDFFLVYLEVQNEINEMEDIKITE